ncbi:MAG: hypothetical protein O4859_23885 [Trichodesmium sp. St18_bin1]|nr:hypothetical protein [Trichodesmium sp. St18_bin1]MDE5121362.1 hypothetical protein [Trichodesmium sp. St19_bin1]
MIKGILRGIIVMVLLMGLLIGGAAQARPITEGEITMDDVKNAHEDWCQPLDKDEAEWCQKVDEAQEKWKEGIINIGEAQGDPQEYNCRAEKFVDELYGYDEGEVFFKPTKALEPNQFRLTEKKAVCYFVGGALCPPDDTGFALHPWEYVEFDNVGIITDSDSAVVMGNYYFTDANSDEMMVEYTFGYIRGDDGELLINVHHSSLPYEPPQ